MNDIVKQRVAGMLLEELKGEERRWFYISCANEDGFLGACLVRAFGPTDAWSSMHRLMLTPKGNNFETATTEIPKDKESVIPEEAKWRFLNPEEVKTYFGE